MLLCCYVDILLCCSVTMLFLTIFFILTIYFLNLYNFILKVLQYSNFSHFGILGSQGPSPRGGGIPGARKPQMGSNTPAFIFDIFKIIGIRNCSYILLIYDHSANLCFFFDSNISGLLQGSLAHYMFLNLISQLLTLNP